IVQVFRREASPYTECRFRLRGIDAAKNYVFTDIDNPDHSLVISGRELTEQGFPVRMDEPRTAKIWLYHEI
ncbi:MAG: hypothetical protein ACI3XM_10405, partial [Eubacteriales bacterium]